jgi:hypothetical protein
MQLTVTQYGAASFAGMLADTGFTDKMSYTAEAAVGFGVPVQLGTNKERQVKVLTTAVGQAALAYGVSIASQVVEQTSAGVAQYAQYDTVPVLKTGRVWMLTNDAVAAGAVANLVLANGTVTDEVVATGIEAFTQFSARFITGTTAAGLAVVEIDRK